MSAWQWQGLSARIAESGTPPDDTPTLWPCVINGQEAIHIQLGDTVAVIGAGPIGIMHAITMALVYLDLYFEEESVICHTQGERKWQLTIREDDESLKTVTGSLGEDILFNGRSISYGLRKFIPITDLWLFDGKNDGIL